MRGQALPLARKPSVSDRVVISAPRATKWCSRTTGWFLTRHSGPKVADQRYLLHRRGQKRSAFYRWVIAVKPREPKAEPPRETDPRIYLEKRRDHVWQEGKRQCRHATDHEAIACHMTPSNLAPSKIQGDGLDASCGAALAGDNFSFALGF